MDNKLYKNYCDNWDNEIFACEVRKHLKSNDYLLDIGAGAGIVTQLDFRDNVSKVCGIDLDPRVLENPFLDEAKIGNCESIQWPNDSFNIIICANVLEHLPAPETVFKEVHRVLKPGGLFIFKTPNRLHYVASIARYTPHWFHEYVNTLRGRNETDTFPTYYRANSLSTIRDLSINSDLKIKEIKTIEGRPEYMRIAFICYIAGFIYERIVNKFSFLKKYRVILIGVLKKTIII